MRVDITAEGYDVVIDTDAFEDERWSPVVSGPKRCRREYAEALTVCPGRPVTAREPGMAERTRTWALSLWAAVALIAVGNAVLTVLAWGELKSTDSYTNLFGSVASLLYVSLGVIVVLRVANRIGWLLIALALTFSTMCLTSAYAVLAVLTHPGALPAGEQVGTVSEWLFIPTFVLMAYMLVLFPTGALPSPRWRPVATTILVVTALQALLFLVAPRSVGVPAPGGTSLVYDNPMALPSLGSVGRSLGTLNAIAVVYLSLLGLGVVALVGRYRRGRGEVRHQILWVALMAGMGLALQAVASAGQVSCGCDNPVVTIVANLLQGAVALIGVPLAITVAILKYRLYQIERLVNGAIVYGFLTITLGAVYLASVLVLQAVLSPLTTQSDVAVAGSTLAAAALFQPARSRIQAAVDRRFYRNRYDATRTLDAFATRLRHELDLETVAGDLRSAVHETWQPEHVSLWLRR